MEKENAASKYKQIKEDIVDDILSGIYEPGDKIPKQNEYAEFYNVSRLTVRRAIDDLVRKGILRTEKGKGTYVREIAKKAYSYRRLAGFSSNVISNEIKVHSKVINISEIKADVSLAKYLQIEKGKAVVVIERLRYGNDTCVAYQKSYFSKARVQSIDFEKENLNENSLYDVLRREAGIEMCYLDEHFRAIRANKQISGYFKIEEGDPILYVKRIAYDLNNVPIEYGKNYESSDVNGVWVRSISI